MVDQFRRESPGSGRSKGASPASLWFLVIPKLKFRDSVEHAAKSFKTAVSQLMSRSCTDIHALQQEVSETSFPERWCEKVGTISEDMWGENINERSFTILFRGCCLPIKFKRQVMMSCSETKCENQKNITSLSSDNRAGMFIMFIIH